MSIRKKLVFQGLTAAAAMGARALAGRGTDESWKLARGKKPPLNPAARNTSWGEALLYGALTGALAGLASVAARRAVTAGWRARGLRVPAGER